MDELVGQLIWAFVGGAEDLDGVEQAIRKGRVGGVWLLPSEMTTPADTAELINRLQAAAPTPLLVGVDAEAGLGLVMRGATLLPTAMAIGASGNTDLARSAGTVTASEAAACGINAVAAPVLDVNVNPANPIINTRSFGQDPDLVAEMGLAFMEGVSSVTEGETRVVPIGKHFPGHGDTVSDSHLQLETVHHSVSRLDAVELLPFKSAISKGIPLLMTAHVAYPSVDPTCTPATLSEPILTELLRERLGFQGAVVTDCMNMHAITHNFDPDEATVRAVRAGSDLVLTDAWNGAYEALLHAILEDQIRGSSIQQAAARVRKLKRQIFGPDLAKPRPISPVTAAERVGTSDNSHIADQIAESSISVLSGAMAAPTTRPLIIATLMARRFGPSVETQLRSALAREGLENADVLILNPVPGEAEIQQALDHARAAGWAALLHFNRVESFDPDAVVARDELTALTEAITAENVPLTVVSMGSPYILPGFASANARLCSYSTSDASVRATLRVLLSSELATGKMPVTVG